jgi:hypothetical protein
MPTLFLPPALSVIGGGDVDGGGKKRKKRARVLRDGQLSLIVFGFDEKVVWSKRGGKWEGRNSEPFIRLSSHALVPLSLLTLKP